MSTLENKMIPRILVVDDEAHLRELLEITLIKMGLHVDSAESLELARDLLRKNSYSLVLTDMRLPDGLGLELVEEVNSQYKNTPIAVITAFGSADNAVGALKAGAFDYVSKPVALDQLRKLVRDALELSSVKSQKETVRASSKAETTSFLLGSSPEIVHVRSQINKLARSMAPVMIAGESGSGKELAAREIHRNSIRADKPFIAVNCGAIPEMLMEAEFFGYRKGAFTGANEDRDGFFQAANGGTLLLDEVADLPLAMQVKLLRAIQERKVRKVGATTEEPVDVRLLSATHQNLNACVETGKFRQDLYYRLNVIELCLPALRQRLSDIPVLAQAILKRITHIGNEMRINNAAISALCQYEFPGNVRELENILERAAAFAEDYCIDVNDLDLRSNSIPQVNVSSPSEELHTADKVATSSEIDNDKQGVEHQTNKLDIESQSTTQTMTVLSKPHVDDMAANFVIPTLPYSLPEYLAQVESELIRIALKKTRNNRTQAAQLLGVSFRQLRYSIQKLKIYED